MPASVFFRPVFSTEKRTQYGYNVVDCLCKIKLLFRSKKFPFVLCVHLVATFIHNVYVYTVVRGRQAFYTQI